MYISAVMRKITLYLLLFFNLSIFSQEIIGKNDQVQIFEDSLYYEVIFKNTSETYSSFYIHKNSLEDRKGIDILKKYILLLFEEPNRKDFLLQYGEDSVFLVYKEKMVKMEIWKRHDSDRVEASDYLTYTDYLSLLTRSPEEKKF